VPALSVTILFVPVINVASRLMSASRFRAAKARAKAISAIAVGTNFTRERVRMNTDDMKIIFVYSDQIHRVNLKHGLGFINADDMEYRTSAENEVWVVLSLYGHVCANIPFNIIETVE
jgi:hypothetical protein